MEIELEFDSYLIHKTLLIKGTDFYGEIDLINITDLTSQILSINQIINHLNSKPNANRDYIFSGDFTGENSIYEILQINTGESVILARFIDALTVFIHHLQTSVNQCSNEVLNFDLVGLENFTNSLRPDSNKVFLLPLTEKSTTTNCRLISNINSIDIYRNFYLENYNIRCNLLAKIVEKKFPNYFYRYDKRSPHTKTKYNHIHFGRKTDNAAAYMIDINFREDGIEIWRHGSFSSASNEISALFCDYGLKAIRP